MSFLTEDPLVFARMDHLALLDAKVTLGFDATVAERAKSFAKANNIGISRLVEFMLSQVADK
jgi:antitoxin component of RelBE/YafQ-DinJ toxin-antitoxin module